MKKISFLSLVSLTLAVTAATAAVQNEDTNLYVLPAYHVTSPRLTEAEKSIERSLSEFALAATQAAPAIRTELPALNTTAHRAEPAPTRNVAHATAPRDARRS